jgi:ribulose-5-phosphate 4-epimerase/fuculose-1-phosphate aldolase
MLSKSEGGGVGTALSADRVEVDLARGRRKGSRQASTELDLHLRAYRQREECSAVVHAHPPEIVLFIPCGTSGTRALGRGRAVSGQNR